MFAPIRTFSSAVVVVVVTNCILSGCKNEGSAQETASGKLAASEETVTTATVKKVGLPRYDEAAFALTIAQAQPMKVGEAGSLSITLLPKAPFHVNAEYPHRFKVSSTKGGTVPSSTVNPDPAKLKPNALELVVPVTPAQTGGGELEGELAFSVCTEEKCLMEKRLLKTAFQVN